MQDNSGEPNPESLAGKLFSAETDPTSYGSGKLYQDHLLQQYKLYVGSADQISDRRQSANSFFLSVNTAIVAVVSFVALALDGETALPHGLISLSGLVICYTWYRLVRSHRDLNTAKFKVIHELEARLPAQPYDAEWEAVGRGKRSDLYLPFTHVEAIVPWVFASFYLVVLAMLIPWDQIARSY